ncbi:MAG TPA: vitamin B12 dependent-methionine synthase activation domain-containing protein [Candidatus Krumholzibacteriaceae bacterium]
MMTPVVLENFSVTVDTAEVRRYLGSKDRKRPAPGERYDDVLNDVLRAAEGLIAPRGIYAYAAGRELAGPAGFARLDRMAVCVSTIGPALEAEVTRLAGGDELLRAVVLDSIGSVAAEAVAEYIDRTIAAEAAREGLATSCRASPGYGDWDVRGQGAIFRLLPAERIGVRLSETFMMAPRKSISFAKHVAKEPEMLRSENSCGNCGRTDCLYRLE